MIEPFLSHRLVTLRYLLLELGSMEKFLKISAENAVKTVFDPDDHVRTGFGQSVY